MEYFNFLFEALENLDILPKYVQLIPQTWNDQDKQMHSTLLIHQLQCLEFR